MPHNLLDENTDDKNLLKEEVNWYDNVEEANLRLANSVVMYDGVPVYVINCEQSREYGDNLIRVFFHALPLSRKEINKAYRRVISSPKFDFKPFSLGLLNVNGQLVYLSRGAVRRYQQGLTDNNLVCLSPTGARHRLVDLIYLQEAFCKSKYIFPFQPLLEYLYQVKRI